MRRRTFQLPLSGSRATVYAERVQARESTIAFNSLSRDHGEIHSPCYCEALCELSTPSLGITHYLAVGDDFEPLLRAFNSLSRDHGTAS
jgi:hypothetical protein